MRYDEHEVDVLIIGAGAAGIRAAIELARHGRSPLVIGKRAHGDAHTTFASGGINAALGNLDSADRWDIHAADTLREGHFLNNPQAVELLCRRAPDRVQELHKWGCAFNETDAGRINQRYFGAQSFRRTCFVGDETGRAILRTLVEQARQLQIARQQYVFITGLLVDDGRVRGALGYAMKQGRFVLYRTGRIVLATGGYASVYSLSTSRHDENTGDGMGLAYQVGVPLCDMEMVQFHPTGRVTPAERAGELVSEAMRGEGGHLLNNAGERFMARYDAQQMELAARDVVARAIMTEIRSGRGTAHGGVWLDISHQDADLIRSRLPKLARQFKEDGVDITRERVEVAPTAHYAMGGVLADHATGATPVDGLYAVGETTAGVHGANRLGGNSLAETVVFGQMVGEHLAAQPEDRAAWSDALASETDAHFRMLAGVLEHRGTHKPEAVIQKIRRMMWSQAGLFRRADQLEAGLGQLAAFRREAEDLAIEAGMEGQAFEAAMNLRCMLPVAEAILRSALHRTESRGAHERDDHPDESDDWRRNIRCCRADDGTMKLATQPVPPLPGNIEQALREGHRLHYHHLE